MTQASSRATGSARPLASRASLNLSGRFERVPLTRYQNKIFVIIATAWLFDSMDLALLTFVLAPISQGFGLSAAAAGFLASSSFAGMLVGASCAGALADRFGRKPVFATSMLVWGVGSLLMAFAWNLPSLVVFRFIIGLGMGAEFPVAQALLSEYIPARYRGRYIGWLEGFWPLGFVAAGAVSLVMVPTLGWRSLFVLQFMLSLYALYVRRSVPESPRWYEVRGRYDDAEATMRRFEERVERASGSPLPEAEPPATPEADQPARLRIAITDLFTPQYRRRTIMAWGMWFCVLMGYYGITSWMGKLLADNGMSITNSIAFVLLMTLWGIPGFLTASYLLDRVGRKPIVSAFILLSAVAAYFYGDATSTVEVLVAGSFMQFFFFGMWSAVYAYTPEVFPTRSRASGCGTSSAMGRLGALIGPSLVPIVLAAWGHLAVFIGAATFFVLGAAILLALGPETKDRVLEEVSG